jgi:phosphinothricin acetyltransferase
MRIRKATLDDLPAIKEIYNHAIENTVATFDTEPITMEEQEEWFRRHGPVHPVVVAEEASEKGNTVLGWASLSEWSDRCAYSDTAEVSVYVREDCRGRGIGRVLLDGVMEKGRKAGLHTVIARIAEGNDVSIRLYESAGFRHIGIMREVGRKFGKLLDVYMMQKIFGK